MGRVKEFPSNEIGQEAAGEAGDDRPAPEPHEFQGEDRGGDRRAEDGGEAGRDAAEEQRAMLAFVEGEPAGELSRQRAAHLQGGAFPSDRGAAKVREQGRADDGRSHRGRQGGGRSLDLGDQGFHAPRGGLGRRIVDPDHQESEDRQGEQEPTMFVEGARHPSQGVEEAGSGGPDGQR